MNMSKNYMKEDQNGREELLKNSGINNEDLKRNVEIIRQWGRQQKHLPQDDLDDDLYIERLLLNNKLRIEQSKTKLDNYYTSKAVFGSFYADLWKIKASESPVCRIALRNLTPDGKWIVLISVQKNFSKIGDVMDCLKFQTVSTEIMNKYCYSVDRVLLIDVKGVKPSLFYNFEATLLYNYLKLVKTCYSGRISAYHIINISYWGSFLLNGISRILGDDTSKKMKIHDNLESLYEEIPRKYLPEDYDGEDISVENYIKIWDEIIEEEEELLRSLQEKVPDESLRIVKSKIDSEMFGVDGTFKKLNID